MCSPIDLYIDPRQLRALRRVFLQFDFITIRIGHPELIGPVASQAFLAEGCAILLKPVGHFIDRIGFKTHMRGIIERQIVRYWVSPLL